MNIDPEHKPFWVDTNLPNPYQGLQYVNFLEGTSATFSWGIKESEEFWAMNFGYQNVKPRDPRNCWCCPVHPFCSGTMTIVHSEWYPCHIHAICRVGNQDFFSHLNPNLGSCKCLPETIFWILEGQDLRTCKITSIFGWFPTPKYYKLIHRMFPFG
jgi:hypothetical protein